jgi:hypothetical protein
MNTLGFVPALGAKLFSQRLLIPQKSPLGPDMMMMNQEEAKRARRSEAPTAWAQSLLDGAHGDAASATSAIGSPKRGDGASASASSAIGSPRLEYELPHRKAGEHASPGRKIVPVLQLSGAEDQKRGGLNVPPRALRSLEDLQKDLGKTGLEILRDLSERFPKGPWLVNLNSQPDDEDGWRAVEERIFFGRHRIRQYQISLFVQFACILELSYTSWVTKVSVPINLCSLHRLYHSPPLSAPRQLVLAPALLWHPRPYVAPTACKTLQNHGSGPPLEHQQRHIHHHPSGSPGGLLPQPNPLRNRRG